MTPWFHCSMAILAVSNEALTNNEAMKLGNHCHLNARGLLS